MILRRSIHNALQFVFYFAECFALKGGGASKKGPEGPCLLRFFKFEVILLAQVEHFLMKLFEQSVFSALTFFDPVQRCGTFPFIHTSPPACLAPLVLDGGWSAHRY